MRPMLLFACAVALLAAPPALADPPHGRGHGHGHGHDDGWVPPGLAKKPYGMPPGQAKKMWRRGELMPRAYYSESRYYIVEPARYHLEPPPPGYRWVLVEDDAYLVRRSNGLVADMVADAVASLVR